jgi:polar amino acid transport system ATP-binding protein
MTLAYSEKKERLELVCESTGEAVNPLDRERLPDELGLTIINNLAESIDYRRIDDKNRLTLLMKKG